MKIVIAAKKPNRQQIELWLQHPDLAIRVQWSKNLEFRPTTNMVHIGLNDDDPQVRRNWVTRTDYMLNNRLIERILSDKDPDVKAALADRSHPFSPKQIDRALSDLSPKVRSKWALKKDIAVTPEQVVRGLEDPNLGVKLSWALRYGAVPQKKSEKDIETTDTPEKQETSVKEDNATKE